MLISSSFNVLILAALVATAIGDSVEFTLCTSNNLPFKFNLSIPANVNTPCNNDVMENLELLNQNQDTFLIIHGWRDEIPVHSSHFGLLINELVAVGYNVILCEWISLAAMDYITNVQFNIKTVGKRIADLVMGLNSLGYGPNRIHIAGHSLGAHVAGVVGKQIESCDVGKIKRIFSMDAASPLFGDTKVLPADNTLAINDADQVIGIHTDGFKQGKGPPVGTIDFYINGGTDPQPHCVSTSNTDILGCSHKSVVWYTAMSIRITNYIGRRCSFFLKLLDFCLTFDCASETAVFGVNSSSNNSTGIFYFETNFDKTFKPAQD